MLYYCHDYNNENNQYFYHTQPYNEGKMYISNRFLQIGKVPFDNNKFPNWIFSGPTFNLSYNSCLATDRKGPIKKISKNGWGFFNIAIKISNTTYTPNKITAIILSNDELIYFPYEIDSPPLYTEIY
jgi:hypothetical protein